VGQGTTGVFAAGATQTVTATWRAVAGSHAALGTVAPPGVNTALNSAPPTAKAKDLPFSVASASASIVASGGPGPVTQQLLDWNKARVAGARYATGVYGVLDAAASKLTLVNAGHPAALVLTPAGSGLALRTLTATGPALGLIEAGTFGSHSVTLQPGTMLVAHTDGVSDAHNDVGDEFGDDRLVTLLDGCRDQDAAAVCATILNAVRDFRGSRQDQDDVTVMVVKAGNRDLGSGTAGT